MIGDRIHDVEGAAQHGIPVVFAGWGYGDAAEAAGSIAVAATPADLPGIVTTR
jgi:phosphoglycolate phosphatase